jgi:DNA invertase Pin-like site-specific DNA recombinase
MLIGYARVSTNDQTINLQRDALKTAGCKRIYGDQGVNGAVTRRRGLDRALASLKPGDTLVVWKLDRLGRSLTHLVQTIAELGARGVNFRSLSDPIDTENAGGRLVLHIMAALAEFERSLNSERTRAGLAAAKRRGRKLGRRRKLAPKQIIRARRLIKAGQLPRNVAKKLLVARSTLYVALNREVPSGHRSISA